MVFNIATPQFSTTDVAGNAGAGGDYVYPSPSAVGSGDRMFMVCDVKGNLEIDEVARRAVYHAVCDTVRAGYDATKPFAEAVFDEAMHSASDVLDSVDGVDGGSVRKGDVSLAFVLLHRGGCFLAATGGAQVMLVRPDSGVIYRSRNVDEHVALDGSDAHELGATMKNITDLQPGDYIYLSNGKAGIMPDEEITAVLADESAADDEKLRRLSLATVAGDVRREYLVRIVDVQADAPAVEATSSETDAKRPNVVRRSSLTVAVVTVLMILWFAVVFVISSYLIDRFNL